MKDRILRNARWIAVTLALMTGAAFLAYALFNAQQTVDHSVSVQGAHNMNLFDTSAFTFADMGPGDTVRGTIGINNLDGAPVSVSTAVVATNADGLGLRDQLVMVVRDLGDVTSGILGTDCQPGETAPIIFTGPLGAEPALAIPGMDVVLGVAGSPTQRHGWCIEITLPAGTSSAFADALTDGQFILTGVD